MTATDAADAGRRATIELDQIADALAQASRRRLEAIDTLAGLGYSYAQIGYLLSPTAPISRQAIRELHIRYKETQQ